jgi:uncharacterized protein (DUF433 family)
MREEHTGDNLIGVTRRRAAHILGVNEARLVSWNRRGLLRPSSETVIGTRGHWTYGLEELVQGLVIRQLEDRGIHIRHIKIFVDAVRSADHPRPLASLRWAVVGTEAFVGYPDGSWQGHRKPAQNVMTEVLDLSEIRTNARTAARSRIGVPGTVEKRRGALGSKPVFAGTRIPVGTVVAYLDAGQTDSQILEAFPLLEPADIEHARSERIAS